MLSRCTIVDQTWSSMDRTLGIFPTIPSIKNVYVIHSELWLRRLLRNFSISNYFKLKKFYNTSYIKLFDEDY